MSQDDAVSFSMRDKPIPMRFNAEDQMMNHGHSFVKRHHLKVALLTFKISRELNFWKNREQTEISLGRARASRDHLAGSTTFATERRQRAACTFNQQ